MFLLGVVVLKCFESNDFLKMIRRPCYRFQRTCWRHFGPLLYWCYICLRNSWRCPEFLTSWLNILLAVSCSTKHVCKLWDGPWLLWQRGVSKQNKGGTAKQPTWQICFLRLLIIGYTVPFFHSFGLFQIFRPQKPKMWLWRDVLHFIVI